MAGRSYQPGHRNPKLKPGHFSENRLAWVTTHIGQFVILTAEESEGQVGKPIRLFHPTGKNGLGFSWDLTVLTVEELNSLRELLETAFEWALPICEARDKEAKDANDQGDDSFTRLYRAVPQLVYRSRPEPIDREGVQHRSADASPAHGNDDAGHGDSIRDGGDDLAERDEGGGEPEDDGAPTD